MRLSFLKSKKGISLESFHKREPSPKKDWLRMIYAFSTIIIVAIIISAFSFHRLFNEDLNNIDSLELEKDTSSVSVDINKLNSAVEFIESRKVE